MMHTLDDASIDHGIFSGAILLVSAFDVPLKRLDNLKQMGKNSPGCENLLIMLLNTTVLKICR